MKFTPALFAALALTVVAANAQTQAPGLWEHTLKLDAQNAETHSMPAQMQAQLAAMPPEQRKKIEEMMKSRGVTMGAQGTTVKFCLTKEQAAKPADPRMPGDCKQNDVKRSGNAMSYRFTCTTPQPVSGEGRVTFDGDKAYTGRSTVTTQVKGQPQSTSIDMSGKWLAADCGDVKPVGALSSK